MRAAGVEEALHRPVDAAPGRRARAARSSCRVEPSRHGRARTELTRRLKTLRWAVEANRHPSLEPRFKDGPLTFTRSRSWLLPPARRRRCSSPPPGAPRPDRWSPAPRRATPRQLEQPFLRWADPAQYFLAPDGSFSGGARGGTLRGGRSSPRTSPTLATPPRARPRCASPPAARSRRPRSASASSIPTMRFFARSDGSPIDALAVEVLFEDAGGRVHALPIGVVPGTAPGRPTLPRCRSSRTSSRSCPGERTAVAFRFTAARPRLLADRRRLRRPVRHGLSS